MEMKFCRRCGGALTHITAHIYKCHNNHTLFANANPSTSIWLLNFEGEVLVTERGIEPGKGKYDSPGGFVDGHKETLEQAVARELKEELGLEPSQYSRLHYLTSTTGWYEYNGEKLPTLDVVFYAMLHRSAVITPKDDVVGYKFVAIDSLDPEAIYLKAIRDGFIELRERIALGLL